MSKRIQGAQALWRSIHNYDTVNGRYLLGHAANIRVSTALSIRDYYRLNHSSGAKGLG